MSEPAPATEPIATAPASNTASLARWFRTVMEYDLYFWSLLAALHTYRHGVDGWALSSFVVNYLYWVITERYARVDKSRSAPAPSDKGNSVKATAVMLITQRIGAIWGLFCNPPNWSIPLHAIFLTLTISFVWLRYTAMIILGEFFTPTLRTKPNHRVITAGPYGWIRHPGYASNCGLVLTNCLWLAPYSIPIGLIVGLLAWAYGERIRLEESMLVEELGDDYRTYQSRTNRLIPFVW